MNDLPSLTFIYGDHFLCKERINSAKEKYKDYSWKTYSLDDINIDEIILGSNLFQENSNEILLIKDISDTKKDRKELLDFCRYHDCDVHFIIWDSLQHIKIDNKTKNISKTWGSFLEEINLIHGSKTIYTGESLTEKNTRVAIDFILDRCKQKEVNIDKEVALTLLNVVGFDYGLLASTIELLTYHKCKVIDMEFIHSNILKTSKSTVLYELSNVLDSASYSKSVLVMQNFIDSGIHPNVIAEIIVRKARWLLTVVSMWYHGANWNEIPDKLMQMGGFPSRVLTQKDISFSVKSSTVEKMENEQDFKQYIKNEYGLNFFKIGDKNKTERIPMKFIASQMVDFIHDKVLFVNKNVENIKEKMLNKYLILYDFILKCQAEVRYGTTHLQPLNKMIVAMTNLKLE